MWLETSEVHRSHVVSGNPHACQAPMRSRTWGDFTHCWNQSGADEDLCGTSGVPYREEELMSGIIARSGFMEQAGRVYGETVKVEAIARRNPSLPWKSPFLLCRTPSVYL